MIEHQVAAVASRDQHSLTAVQSGSGTDIEIPFDLLVDAADRQHLAVLVEGPGDRDALLERQTGQG